MWRGARDSRAMGRRDAATEAEEERERNVPLGTLGRRGR